MAQRHTWKAYKIMECHHGIEKRTGCVKAYMPARILLIARLIETDLPNERKLLNDCI